MGDTDRLTWILAMANTFLEYVIEDSGASDEMLKLFRKLVILYVRQGGSRQVWLDWLDKAREAVEADARLDQAPGDGDDD